MKKSSSARPALPARSARSARIRRRVDRGFTLIEVMVALIVLVLGVLGAAAMTLTALRDSKQSSLRSQAVAAAYELGDLMRMNPGQIATVYLMSPPSGAVRACYQGGCTLTELSTNDYFQWITKVKSPATGLPNLIVKVCRDASNPNSMTACDGLLTSPVAIKMKWDIKLNDGTFGTLNQTAAAPNLMLAIQIPPP